MALGDGFRVEDIAAEPFSTSSCFVLDPAAANGFGSGP